MKAVWYVVGRFCRLALQSFFRQLLCSRSFCLEFMLYKRKKVITSYKQTLFSGFLLLAYYAPSQGTFRYQNVYICFPLHWVQVSRGLIAYLWPLLKMLTVHSWMINRLFFLKARICFLLCQYKNSVLKMLCVQSLFEECCVLILETLSCLHETLFFIN